jgi:hypothetical protein
LSIFFNSISACSNLEIIIDEPGNESHGRPEELKCSKWRGDFSYTHDYKFYAESAGMITLKCEIIKPYLPYTVFPMNKNTVHYTHIGKTRNCNW